jgi:hypothetical protein
VRPPAVGEYSLEPVLFGVQRFLWLRKFCFFLLKKVRHAIDGDCPEEFLFGLVIEIIEEPIG